VRASRAPLGERLVSNQEVDGLFADLFRVVYLLVYRRTVSVGPAIRARARKDQRKVTAVPEEFEGAPLGEALGGIEWTPLREGVSATVERLRAAPA
jgi:hypothetical protein